MLSSQIRYRQSCRLLKIPAYWLANARVFWTDSADKWTVTASGENLAEKRYVQLGIDVASFGFRQETLGQSRWWKVRIERRL